MQDAQCHLSPWIQCPPAGRRHVVLIQRHNYKTRKKKHVCRYVHTFSIRHHETLQHTTKHNMQLLDAGYLDTCRRLVKPSPALSAQGKGRCRSSVGRTDQAAFVRPRNSPTAVQSSTRRVRPVQARLFASPITAAYFVISTQASLPREGKSFRGPYAPTLGRVHRSL